MDFWLPLTWPSIQTFSLSCIQQVLSTYCVPGLGLDTRDAVVNQTGKVPTIMELTVQLHRKLAQRTMGISSQGFSFRAMLASIVRKKILAKRKNKVTLKQKTSKQSVNYWILHQRRTLEETFFSWWTASLVYKLLIHISVKCSRSVRPTLFPVLQKLAALQFRRKGGF